MSTDKQRKHLEKLRSQYRTLRDTLLGMREAGQEVPPALHMKWLQLRAELHDYEIICAPPRRSAIVKG